MTPASLVQVARAILVAWLVLACVPSTNPIPSTPPTPPPSVAPTPAFTAIAAGFDHTCALTSRGGVKCWGANSWTQDGNPATYSSGAFDVEGLTSGVRAIAAGPEHTCALTVAGGVKCWGRNAEGQLGDGTTVSTSVPVDVTGLTSGVSGIAAGDLGTCALVTSTKLTCWGGTYKSRTEVAVIDAVSIVSGGRHGCALTSGRGVMCWGWNDNGELGNGTASSSFTRRAVDVFGLGGPATAIGVGGSSSCALMASGAVKCWGGNGAGQLGNGSSFDSSVPVDVAGLGSGVIAIAAGNHACAVTDVGGVKCWGWNEVGQVGDGTTTSRRVPVDVPELSSGVTAIATGASHTCAITIEDEIKCWGRGAEGQLGNGADENLSTSSPIDVQGLR